MSHDALASVVRLRRLAVHHSRKALAECLRAEEEAEAEVGRIAAAIEQETEAASRLSSSDADVEAFAAWLHRIRPEQHAAHSARDEAEDMTNQARAVLAAARAAVQAAEVLIERHEAAERAKAERRAQRDLDEAAARSSSLSNGVGGN